MAEVNSNADMLFAGTNEPLAYIRLCSIALPPEQTTEISKTLTSTVAAELDITPDRIYIEFSDVERHMWGWKGRTFAAK